MLIMGEGSQVWAPFFRFVRFFFELHGLSFNKVGWLGFCHL